MSLRIFYHPHYSALTLPERHRFPWPSTRRCLNASSPSTIRWHRPPLPAVSR